MRDLVILTPDSAYKQVLAALTARHQALRIRAIQCDVITDPLRDSSSKAVELLRPYLRSHDHALLLRDLEGSGQEASGRQALEKTLNAELQAAGWSAQRATALVVEPELEAWLRFGSSHMIQAMEERARANQALLPQCAAQISGAIEVHGGMAEGGKPKRPKEVFREVLKFYRIPPANAIMGHLANVESLKGCQVSSFLQLCATLRGWFPQT